MIKISLIILSTILVGLIIIFAWCNRDSDRVVLTLVTAMMIGALGFITKESISNKLETSSKSIPVVVFYGLPDYKPLNIKLPYIFDTQLYVQSIDLKNDFPKIDTTNIDIEFASDIYFDVIQFIVVQNVFRRFHNSWNVIAKKTRTPGGESLSWQGIKEKKAMEITASEFFKKIPNNYFVKKKLYENWGSIGGGKAVLPPNTKISTEVDDGKHKLSIFFGTRYIKLIITISKSSSSVGIGEYAKLLGMPSASSNIHVGASHSNGHSNYSIDIKIEQNYWLNGHPEMKKHRNWANAIADLLDSNFNYESIREEHLKQFNLFGASAIRFF